MTDDKNFEQIVPPEERYCFPGPNDVRFISNRQTLSLVLGSCISTVFIGKNDKYILAANHVLMAKSENDSVLPIKGAEEQIDEILEIFEKAYAIYPGDCLCLHLVGGGKKVAGEEFRVHKENVSESTKILAEKKFDILFKDTNSYFYSTYSINNKNLSVFIEDKIREIHLSFVIDLDQLFRLNHSSSDFLPASALIAGDRGFEEFVNSGVVVFITGNQGRRYHREYFND